MKYFSLTIVCFIAAIQINAQPCTDLACDRARVAEILAANSLPAGPEDVDAVIRVENNRVIAFLVRGYSGLTTLPAAIGDISELEILYPAQTGLTALPPEIGNLTKLEELSVFQTNLGSSANPIPATIGQLTALKKLDAHNCGLKSDQIPAELWSLDLRGLRLGQNQLDAIPSAIGNMSNLNYLNIADNGITNFPSEIVNLTNLTRLELGVNPFTPGPLPPEIYSLTNLTFLNAPAMGITSVSGDIGNLTELTRLDLGDNPLTSIPDEIGLLNKLKSLNLQKTEMTTLPDLIGNLSNLTTLILHRVPLISLPASIVNLTLTSGLDLSRTNLCPQTLSHEINQWIAEYHRYGPLESCANFNPIADAGPDQAVKPGFLVTLDGSGSYDPDADQTLSFYWTMLSKPANSIAVLNGRTTVNPTFNADVAGNYNVELTVTDPLNASDKDNVVVSTVNTAPVADAGEDQSITIIGSTITLNGSQSYDPDGDDFTYAWIMTGLPEGSSASLSGETTVSPAFVPDVYGEYIIQLIVTDEYDAFHTDEVMVNFDNLAPIADAGVNLSGIVGDNFTLDGSGSSDANGDILSYHWQISNRPPGSQAELSDPNAVKPAITVDVAGQYVVRLEVSDGALFSNPESVTIAVISVEDAVTQTLQEASTTITSLDLSVFKNKNMRNALTKKINSVLLNIEAGNFEDSHGQLENDLIKKTNGCADAGSPDKNDWITDCGGQGEVYPILIDALDLIAGLLE